MTDYELLLDILTRMKWTKQDLQMSELEWWEYRMLYKMYPEIKPKRIDKVLHQWLEGEIFCRRPRGKSARKKEKREAKYKTTWGKGINHASLWALGGSYAKEDR